MNKPTTNQQLRELRVLVGNVLTIIDDIGRYHGEHGRRRVATYMREIEQIGIRAAHDMYALNHPPKVGQLVHEGSVFRQVKGIC
jgi:hypothetical protein